MKKRELMIKGLKIIQNAKKFTIRSNIKEAVGSLQFFQGANFTGSNFLFLVPRTAGIAIRNLTRLNFNNTLSSFTFSAVSSQATLVLFQTDSYGGASIVYKGSFVQILNLTAVPGPGGNWNNTASSFVFVPRLLTASEIKTIGDSRSVSALSDVVEIV